MAGKLLKYLPKPTSFSIPTASGSGGAAAPYRAAFSGPINISIIPKEARRKMTKKRSEEPDFEEPTSPKVSCMGQVKNKHKKKKKIVKNKKEKKEKEKEKKIQELDEEKTKKKKPSEMQSLFSRKVRQERAAAVEVEAEVPEIGMMRRFRSGRETLGDFDWRMVIERRDDDEFEEEEDEILVPHSAPILMGGGVMAADKRKMKEEVNLWKRRILSPPKPLQV